MSIEPPTPPNSDNELHELWQSQELGGGNMPVEQILSKVNAFERKVYWRNGVEYAAAAVVTVGFGYQVLTGPNAFIQVGAALILLATLFVVITLLRQGASRSVPAELGRNASLDFYRASLERQRDLLNGIWRWYLLPFVPGIAVMLLGAAVRDGVWLSQAAPLSEQGAGAPGILLVAAAFVALFIFAATLNKRKARSLQRELDSLD